MPTLQQSTTLTVTVNTFHEEGKINHAVRVSPLVIVPANNLMEVVTEMDTSRGVNNAGPLVMDKVLTHNRIVGVPHDVFEFLIL